MFKARFVGWDDVLAVDYTLSADYVAKASKQLGVTVRAKYDDLLKLTVRIYLILTFPIVQHPVISDMEPQTNYRSVFSRVIDFYLKHNNIPEIFLVLT